MADERDDTDRSEDPTHKRLEEAHKRGDVVKSQEVNTWFVFAGAALVLMTFSGSMSAGLMGTFRGILANAHGLRVDGPGLLHLASRLGIEVIAATAIPILLLALAAIGGNLVQHRLVWSAEGLKPRLGKVSPMAGLKRLFSKHALVNLTKGLLKLALLGAIMTALLWPQRHRLEMLVGADLTAVVALVQSLSLELLGAVVAVLAFIAAADFLYQYRQWFERQKMSVRELKEEFKQSEGDPMIKGKIRQIRQNRMRKRMMAAVPTASVVVTNPTHYAVALRYDQGMNAPLCVAKGVDAVARKIREVALEHSVPIVENPPLARALHGTVEVDREIPPEHYKAVAEVIGYVMRLRRSGIRGQRPVVG
jgi:flagellar biosynthesis protein FlhB